MVAVLAPGESPGALVVACHTARHVDSRGEPKAPRDSRGAKTGNGRTRGELTTEARVPRYCIS
jgi:hypothetical protein